MSDPATERKVLNIGVLLSGSGTTLENLIRRIADGRLRNVTIRGVISSRSTVRGVEIARAAGLPVEVVRRKDFADEGAFSDRVTACLDTLEVDLVVMAGYLCLWRFPPRYEGRVLNIHPALLPAYGGKGMYGHRVHEAVLAAGETETGCTVHVADHKYDHGPNVAQRRVPVRPGDDADSLAARVQAQERELYPEVIQQIADHGLAWLTARIGP